jgi:hypothetical protein
MNNTNQRRKDQLGMPFGTACGRLRKKIMFDLVRRLKENFCFRCGLEIESESDLTIEHKEHWLDSDPDLFWNLDNIAFSHSVCNTGYKRNGNLRRFRHGTFAEYENHGCRCDECKEWKRKKNKETRERRKNLPC